ncbi:outer envelope pore protein 21, chloroplastic-like isoform X2 [Panicum miliaceum]|uniref:Outer envelope pore protein 21, chloroplastic-like isoform X2 n=1 Tax=Panicum miliaceum TaxID=4540 RepID=A0A3L6RN16_PANMI|nr:outer envelope pore protein 21, chloroplastic-like isoform X2 [Panicum miliaceum]
METSLRLRSGGGLRIHAKEKLPLGYNSLIQAANVGAGVHLHKGDDLTYNLRAKKAIPFTSNGLLGLSLKGRLLTDTEFKPKKRTGAVEFAWTILDLRKGQDVRLKLGYEFYDKVPYLQLRENNWTLNAYMDGKWDVRFDM